jgi:hypothetical protein
MTDKSNQQGKKTDWSRVESVIGKEKKDRSANDRLADASEGTELISVQSNVPAPLNVPLPDTKAPRGILMQWKKNQLDRKTAIQALEAQYNSQLDALRYHLSKAVSVSNARADRIAEEFLKQLDSEHIEVLKDLGLRNADTRARALIEVRDTIAARLAEVQEKNWPAPLIERTINDLIDLEKRVCSEMMRELGG